MIPGEHRLKPNSKINPPSQLRTLHRLLPFLLPLAWIHIHNDPSRASFKITHPEQTSHSEYQNKTDYIIKYSSIPDCQIQSTYPMRLLHLCQHSVSEPHFDLHSPFPDHSR